MNTAVLVPAYGRDYTDAAAVLIDFDLNKDFIMCTVTDRWVGKPCNKEDLLKSDYSHAEIRYNKKQDFVLVHLWANKPF